MTDVLHLKAKKHGVVIWKSDWKSKNSWLNGFHLSLVCTKVVKMWKRSKKLTQTVSSAILQLGTTDSPLFWWRTCCIETRMHMTWDITHFHFWVFQVFYPSNQLQTIRFCVKKNTLKWIFLQVKAILQHKVSFIKIVFLHNEDAINLLQLPDQPICGLLPISGIDSDVLSKFSPPYHWFSFQESMIMMTDTILMKDILKSRYTDFFIVWTKWWVFMLCYNSFIAN